MNELSLPFLCTFSLFLTHFNLNDIFETSVIKSRSQAQTFHSEIRFKITKRKLFISHSLLKIFICTNLAFGHDLKYFAIFFCCLWRQSFIFILSTSTLFLLSLPLFVIFVLLPWKKYWKSNLMAMARKRATMFLYDDNPGEMKGG